MNELVIHGIYRHYKGDLYIVEGTARHTETGEELVIYRGLYKSDGVHGQDFLCARPKEMFLSEIEPEKLRPGLEQRHRFELQTIESKAH